MTLVSIEALASYAPAERLERDRFFVALGAVENEVSNGFARIPTTNSGEPRMCAADAEAMLKVIAEENWEFFDGVRERYMPLPMDADGVPIRVGDVVAAQDEQPFEVRAFQLDALGWFAIERLGSQWNVNQLHHVKPHTVEDVLREFAKSGTPTGEGGVLFETALIEKYADKLRDLFGGDER